MSWMFYRLYTNSVDQLDGAEPLLGPRISRFLYTFLRESSVHGFSHIVKEPGIIKKVIWLLAVVVCGFGLYFFLQALLLRFYRPRSYLSTSRQAKPAREVFFPAVTICNNNPVTVDWFRKYSHLTSATNADGDWTRIAIDSLLTTGNERQQAGHFLCDMVMACHFNSTPCNIDKEFGTSFWDERYGNCFTFNAGFRRQDSPVRQVTTDVWLLKLGGLFGRGVKATRQTGEAPGLRLLLVADDERYLAETQQVGWRIVIHNQTDKAWPDESAIAIMPGTSTKIAISQKFSKKLNSENHYLYKAYYSDCIEPSSLLPADDLLDNYSAQFEVRYSRSGCLRSCYHKHVMAQCQCYDPMEPSPGTLVGKLRPCSALKPADSDCMRSVRSFVIDEKSECNCPEVCSSYTFGSTISALKWPNMNPQSLKLTCNELLAISLKRANGSDESCQSASRLRDGDNNTVAFSRLASLCSLIKSFVDNNNDGRVSSNNLSEALLLEQMAQHVIGKSYAEVSVFYNDLATTSTVEEEMDTLLDFITYIGAIFGLFFGVSIVTAFEFLIFFTDLAIVGTVKLATTITAAFKKCRRAATNNAILTPGRRSIADIQVQMAPVDPKNVHFQVDDEAWS